MERAAGLEPTSPAGLADVLPVELCTQNAPCGAVWQRFLSSVRLSGGSPSAVLSLRRSLAPLQGFVFVYQAQFFFGVRPSPALPGRSEFGIPHHRRETVAVLGLPPSRAGRLGFRFGCGRCRATWPPRCWSAFCHAAAVLGRCFLLFSAVFVPLWFQNVTQRLIFFASHPKKRRAFLAPCRGGLREYLLALRLPAFTILPELSRPCCRQLAVMRRLLGRLSAWGFGRGSRRTRERSLKAALRGK